MSTEQETTNDAAQNRNTLLTLLEEFDTAMLVTRSLNGELRARPMAVADHSEGGALFFATRAEAEKLEEIAESPAVAVTMQADDRFLSISGRARLQTSNELAAELWSPAMRLWFPEGVTDPALTIIVVDPTYAEYWDRSGPQKLEFLLEAGKALLRGEQAADDELSGHAKIKLP